MNRLTHLALAIGLSFGSCAALADSSLGAPPTSALTANVAGMPTAATQEIRVLTALLEPGQQSVFHTHRFPVTTYVLDGELTLDIEGTGKTTLKAGEAYVEEPGKPTTARNDSTTDDMRVVIFYVSDPDTPFMDPISQ